MIIFDVLVALLALPVLPPALYLAFLAFVARKAPAPGESLDNPTLTFDIVVPAHNESTGISATVASLSALHYPAHLRRILVVADNCTDDTADKAKQAGAEVLVRNDDKKRGKGYALELAFKASAKKGFARAVVVVDADTLVSPNLLLAFAEKVSQGAHAMQASYGVSNPLASWRTRLMTIALALFNDLRSLGRERLHLSSGLKGNGMCFTHRLLKAVPHEAFSIVEDLEYGIKLGMAGHRVHYVEDASVKGEMVSTERASRSQRQRWEGGRMAMAKQYAAPLLVRAVQERSALLFDLGFDLSIPPLSYLALGAFAVSMCWLFGSSVDRGLLALSSPIVLVTDVCLVFYVMRGWALSGVGLRGLLDLAWAPVFIGWKVMLLLSRSDRSKNTWVRTARESEKR